MRWTGRVRSLLQPATESLRHIGKRNRIKVAGPPRDDIRPRQTISVSYNETRGKTGSMNRLSYREGVKAGGQLICKARDHIIHMPKHKVVSNDRNQ